MTMAHIPSLSTAPIPCPNLNGDSSFFQVVLHPCPPPDKETTIKGWDNWDVGEEKKGEEEEDELPPTMNTELRQSPQKVMADFSDSSSTKKHFSDSSSAKKIEGLASPSIISSSVTRSVPLAVEESDAPSKQLIGSALLSPRKQRALNMNRGFEPVSILSSSFIPFKLVKKSHEDVLTRFLYRQLQRLDEEYAMATGMMPSGLFGDGNLFKNAFIGKQSAAEIVGGSRSTRSRKSAAIAEYVPAPVSTELSSTVPSISQDVIDPVSYQPWIHDGTRGGSRSGKISSKSKQKNKCGKAIVDAGTSHAVDPDLVGEAIPDAVGGWGQLTTDSGHRVCVVFYHLSKLLPGLVSSSYDMVGGDRFVDLGSGFGRQILQVSMLFPGVEAHRNNGGNKQEDEGCRFQYQRPTSAAGSCDGGNGDVAARSLLNRPCALRRLALPSASPSIASASILTEVPSPPPTPVSTPSPSPHPEHTTHAVGRSQLSVPMVSSPIAIDSRPEELSDGNGENIDDLPIDALDVDIVDEDNFEGVVDNDADEDEEDDDADVDCTYDGGEVRSFSFERKRPTRSTQGESRDHSYESESDAKVDVHDDVHNYSDDDDDDNDDDDGGGSDYDDSDDDGHDNGGDSDESAEEVDDFDEMDSDNEFPMPRVLVDGLVSSEEAAKKKCSECRGAYSDEAFMIACSFCDEWNHGNCVNVRESRAKCMETYCCDPCKQMEQFGVPLVRRTKEKKKRKRCYTNIIVRRAAPAGCIKERKNYVVYKALSQRRKRRRVTSREEELVQWTAIATRRRKASSSAFGMREEDYASLLPPEEEVEAEVEGGADGGQYCVCQSPYDARLFYVQCNDCDQWYHGQCVGLREVDCPDVYTCSWCRRSANVSRLQALGVEVADTRTVFARELKQEVQEKMLMLSPTTATTPPSYELLNDVSLITADAEQAYAVAGATHIFGFDKVFPKCVLKTIAKNINRSCPNWRVAMTFRPDVYQKYLKEAVMVAKFQTSMMTSNAKHTGYIFIRWKGAVPPDVNRDVPTGPPLPH
eukprot:TRINITY_DN1124_c0_g1_i1.p1 TRINITY_DN1124_c0_g1~~TRINITY_DN1124_c0_g1_i1.p1  ORF type:complete len:1032 (-),score=211.01 TRINITY_DN1124_c0_g1_i1:20-3115(-)